MKTEPIVTKSNAMDTYRIRVGYEWATICLQGWQGTGNDGQPREIGDILIHSSFGAWGYQWGHLGMPFKAWLFQAERDYVASKFLGINDRVFDGAGTVKDLRRSLIETRRTGDITKAEARELWNYIEDNDGRLESSSQEFCDTMMEFVPDKLSRGLAYFLSEPWGRIAKKPNPQFEGFWRTIWPVLLQQIRSELHPASDKEKAA